MRRDLGDFQTPPALVAAVLEPSRADRLPLAAGAGADLRRGAASSRALLDEAVPPAS